MSFGLKSVLQNSYIDNPANQQSLANLVQGFGVDPNAWFNEGALTAKAQARANAAEPFGGHLGVAGDVLGGIGKALPYVGPLALGAIGAGALGLGPLAAGGATGSGLAGAGLEAAGVTPAAASATTSGLAQGGALLGGAGAAGSAALGGGGSAAPAASGATDLGSGLAVDEFGNVTGGVSGSGGGAAGASNIGGGMTVDEYGNVTGAGGGGSGAAGGGAALGGLGLGQIAAGAIPAALGAFGANQQANAYGNLAGQYMAMGAPYRSRLSDLYNNPDDFLNSKEVQIPVQQATNVLARSLSRGGNPIGSGNALQELQNYSSNLLFSRLGQEKDRLAGFGGLSAYNQAAPGAAAAGIGAQKGIYDALGAGVADILNPPQRYTLQDLMRGY